MYTETVLNEALWIGYRTARVILHRDKRQEETEMKRGDSTKITSKQVSECDKVNVCESEGDSMCV